MPCRFNGVRGIVKARRQLCLGLDRAGRRCGLRDTRCNMSTRSRSRLASLACVVCITCRCLASRWSSNTLAHRGCFQTYIEVAAVSSANSAPPVRAPPRRLSACRLGHGDDSFVPFCARHRTNATR